MTKVQSSARRASNSPVATGIARFGLAARGFVYLVVGWIALQLALGHRGQEANQRGALAEIAARPFGRGLLWVLAFGLAAYGIWRLSEAMFGTAAEGRKPGPRLQSAVKGTVYVALAVSTVGFIVGASHQTQAKQQVTLTARVMKEPAGRWLVALAGLIAVGIGVGLVVEGIRRKFEKELRMKDLRGPVGRIVLALGVLGTVARGVVFALAGLLILEAAARYEPSKSTGLDGALRTLSRQAYGPWLLGVVALGLLAFGLYGLSMARYAKT